MQKYLLDTCYWFFILAIFNSVALVSSWAAENLTHLPPRQGTLEVTYDAGTDLLSIQAHGVPLGKVIQKITKKTSLTVKSLKEDLLEEPISLEVKKLSLERAMKKLLQGFNSVFLYSPAPATKQISDTYQLVRVFLLSKKDNVQSNALTEPQATGHQKKAPSKDGELIRAIVAKKPRVAREIVEVLKKKGTEEDLEEAVDALVETMIASLLAGDATTGHTYYGTLGALKELAPARAVDPLVNLLQDQKAGTLVHALAARALGEMGQESAVGPLMSAFDSHDSDVRDAAAFGLARIGGDTGRGFLLQVLRNGELDLQQSAATALAFWGDRQARAALKQVVAEGQLGKGAIPQNVMEEVISPRKIDKPGTMPAKNKGE